MSKLNIFENRPKLPPINIKEYLTLMGLKSKPLPDFRTLKLLHRNHLLTFPFENIDIHFGKRIILDINSIQSKILGTGRRGGICYELNGLFYHLLFHLGYDVRLVSASVARGDGLEFGAEYDHMAMIVRLEGIEYLVDVGFGSGFCLPKILENGLVQMDYNHYFRLSYGREEFWSLQSSKNGIDFKNLYQFTSTPREFIQFIDMCDYHQSSALSPFTQGKIVSKITREGRISLKDNEMEILKLGDCEKIKLLNEDEFYSKLEQHFGIIL